ncbi:hypothetical protein SPRG_08540 [Saprolegnia parasitica CBS 223.65]|uniref:Lipoyl-binding domain-containing protein n=1 Tax=Saprolegnia parasitica (strain CBS 223.65) TaxID=695850 RepID=A0A067C618_SAPPC|nr:hypothetical protein SPRG_08540 [Saprolegnia parasitica CBS 223.65]KDO26179.1 hypothetical protein SPRG_08540 [Saprolegnia parasitica CBS 223.65]|eukprot:XP_012203172.1 hypothetical protein SPRG_08540 [Saprolegnia parasitica CBS 223.65]
MMFLRRGSAPMASLLGRRWCHASKLPNHIKFRLMDIEFTQVMEGSKLVKWYKQEGQKVGPGGPLCDIETPELIFGMETDDAGYLAKIFVPAGAENVRPNQVLAVIVPKEEDIAPFIQALAENPSEIEEYKPSTPVVVDPTTITDGSDLLRVLSQLNKEGAFPSESDYKVLKSLARKNDAELLRVYSGSFLAEGGAAFDKEFFVENCLDLVEEHAADHV